MNLENKSELHNEGRALDLSLVPDWRFKPGSRLWEFGQPLSEIQLTHNSETVEVAPEVLALRKVLETKTSANFFNGPLANVESLQTSDHGLSINTTETDFFTYLASSYHHRDQVGKNTVRPLAVQATIFTPRCEKIILERRPESLTDFPNKLSVFGGSLKPGEYPNETVLKIINRKLGLNLATEQIKPTGLVRENIDNVFCITYAIELNEDQYRAGYERARDLIHRRERMFYQVSVDEAQHSMERILTGKRTINQWDPNAFFNLLYALGAKGLRNRQRLEAIVVANDATLSKSPMEYTFPIEKYLNQSRTKKVD